jgi:hypothetical protein
VKALITLMGRRMSSLIILIKAILSALVAFYDFWQNDGFNIWLVIGAVFAVIGIWQVQALLPDRDAY